MHNMRSRAVGPLLTLWRAQQTLQKLRVLHLRTTSINQSTKKIHSAAVCENQDIFVAYARAYNARTHHDEDMHHNGDL